MTTVSHLDIFIKDRLVGGLSLLPGDRSVFAFSEAYLEDASRPTLSLSMKDSYGDIISATKATQTKVPPFFSNLLPEGIMRDYLAARAGVKEAREFFLLWVLGEDLPGAIVAKPSDGVKPPPLSALVDADRFESTDDHLKFSLAGVQLKFSAIMRASKGLTIPARGLGGDWIVKLPDLRFEGVPENEFSMMTLAAKIGIDVPDIDLVPLDDIHGLPRDIADVAGQAFIIRRFDRSADGGRIHMEDFAQVFGLYPDRKYERASHGNIAGVIAAEIGVDGVEDYIRRLVFNVLIGNGDMHLKNWSLLFPDGQRAAMAPAYDYVSTIPYIGGETFALSLGGVKDFDQITMARFSNLARKARLSEKLVARVVRETVEAFRDVWSAEKANLPMPAAALSAIDAHLMGQPLAQ